jgi:hypothetical protein
MVILEKAENACDAKHPSSFLLGQKDEVKVSHQI